MDALREQYEGGFKMSAYKDKTQGTWYVSFRYIDWTGKKTQKLKRGFKTKKEALNYEKEFMMLSGKLNDAPSGRLFRADLEFLQRCPSL